MKSFFLMAVLVSIGCHLKGQTEIFKCLYCKGSYTPLPADVQTAVSQIENDLTDRGRVYLKGLREEFAVIQVDGATQLASQWKLLKGKNPLVRYFNLLQLDSSPGAIVRTVIAALHSKLNNKAYDLRKLNGKYAREGYDEILKLRYNFAVGDTVFGSWYTGQHPFDKPSGVCAWGTVVEVDTVKHPKIKVFRITVDDKPSMSYKDDLKVGEITARKSGDWNLWDTVAKWHYVKL